MASKENNGDKNAPVVLNESENAQTGTNEGAGNQDQSQIPPAKSDKGADGEKPKSPAAAVAVNTNAEKEVKVMAIEDHKCNIGGKDYNLRQNKEYSLPASIATILSNARKVIKK